MLLHRTEPSKDRPASPPEAIPRPKPIRGPMRNIYERDKAEKREQELLAIQAEQAREGSSAAGQADLKASGLGYGSTHLTHYVYTRSAPLKGIFFVEEAERVSAKVIEAGSAKLKKDDGSPDPQGYVDTKTRFKDPLTLAAPQALGYGRRHAHYSHYLAPVQIPTPAHLVAAGSAKAGAGAGAAGSAQSGATQGAETAEAGKPKPPAGRRPSHW